MLTQVLFLFGLAGLVSCTVFLLLLLIAAVHRRHIGRSDKGELAFPKATLLKPLCGLEPNLEANLESFFQQDYPTFEIVFGARQLDDPALRLARDVAGRYPHVPVKFIASGEPDRPNAKVCSLEKMCATASSDYFVISDSDVHVQPHYLRSVVLPLLDPNVGLVTCLYRGVPTGGIWSRLEALGMSVEMTSGVLVADLLEGMRFALGPTMAVRRHVLADIGGMAGLAEFCADDYVLGHRVHQHGWKVVLSDQVIDHVVISRACKPSMLHQLRWAKSTRFSRGLAHLGSGLTFAMPYGWLAMGAGFALQRPLLAWGLIGWAVANRMLLSLVAGWGVVGDRRALRDCWLYPLRDFLGFCFWLASYFGSTIVWRNDLYRLEAHGKMKRVGAVQPESAHSEPVTVDDLA